MENYIRHKKHLQKTKKRSARKFMKWKRKEHANN